LWRKLEDIAQRLDISPGKRCLITQWLMTGIKTHQSILCEMLEEWRANLSVDAKSNTFIGVLCALELNECAGKFNYLFKIFNQKVVVSDLKVTHKFM